MTSALFGERAPSAGDVQGRRQGGARDTRGALLARRFRPFHDSTHFAPSVTPYRHLPCEEIRGMQMRWHSPCFCKGQVTEGNDLSNVANHYPRNAAGTHPSARREVVRTVGKCTGGMLAEQSCLPPQTIAPRGPHGGDVHRRGRPGLLGVDVPRRGRVYYRGCFDKSHRGRNHWMASTPERGGPTGI